MKFLAVIPAFFLWTGAKSVVSLPLTESQLDLETCMFLTGQYYTGLRPVSASTPVDPPVPCQLFWYCRATLEGSSLPVVQVSPQVFNCSHADPNKPYYDARICQCVETSEDCGINDDIANQYKCVRPYNANEHVESCRGFGPRGTYYTELFSSYTNPHHFWSCQPNNMGPPIPSALQCPSDLIFDARNGDCRCHFNATRQETEEILAFNNHPMNRFKCARPL